MWGEPYGRAGLIPRMAQSALALTGSWPPAGYIAPTPMPSDLGSRWIGNLYPEPAALRDGMRAQLDTWLATPAQARGCGRWGVKEVRWDATVGHFLAWLYPDARFVFLIRDPWACWASAKGTTWYRSWPGEPVRTLADFIGHWRHLAESFLTWPTDNGLLTRYEDLIAPRFPVDALAQHTGIRVDTGALQARLRGLATPPVDLTPAEIDAVEQAAGPVVSALGYARPAAR